MIKQNKIHAWRRELDSGSERDGKVLNDQFYTSWEIFDHQIQTLQHFNAMQMRQL